MTIKLAEWNKYIRRLRMLNDKAVKDFTAFIVNHGGIEMIDRSVLIDYAYALTMKYGEASAALSAEMYDAVALLQGVTVPAAIPAETAAYSEVAKTVNGIIKKTGSQEIVAQSVGLLVKDAGQKTTIQNARRDKAEIAFISSGDTCAFCIMMAGKGWRRASASDMDKDGEPAHLHANCDCTYAVRFNKDLDYSGYEPEKYKEIYDNAPLDDGQRATAKNKLNAMRREFYAQNKDEINEQKRSAYEKRKERESSEAEEMNVN